MATRLELEDGSKIDFDPVIFRVMGVYRVHPGRPVEDPIHGPDSQIGSI